MSTSPSSEKPSFNYNDYVLAVPGFDEKLPPKDGLLSAVTLLGRPGIVYIWWDAAWGGRGGWFTQDNKAVAEKSIFNWEKRVETATHYLEIRRRNAILEFEREKTL
jgi:hypothetical protein